MEFSSIRAIITGGVSGLGLAVARRFAAAGGKLALFDVNAEQAETAVAEGSVFWVETNFVEG